MLVYLHSQGENKIPTRLVFNQFKKRGIEVSLGELQRLFSMDTGFVKSIDKDYVEFGSRDNKYSYKGEDFNKDMVSQLAAKMAKKSLNR